jgi:hypothetical protein
VGSTPNAVAPTPEPRWKRSALLGTDARIGLAALALCCALILGLRLVARDSPAAGRLVVVTIPTPVVSTDDGCTAFARFWMDKSGVGASAATIEGISNCRQATDGTWFVPRGPDDPRLPAGAGLSPEQVEATAELRAEIEFQLAALETEFPATLQLWLKQMFDPFARAVTGNIRDGYDIRTVRDRYTRLVQAYLMAPDRAELADYVGWIMATRIHAERALEADCKSDPLLSYLLAACMSIYYNLNIRYQQFPWELESPLWLDSYLVSRLGGGGAGTPASGG